MIKYENMQVNKAIILRDNQAKFGVYQLTNIITNKSYVGNSINLSKRLSNYYSNSYLRSHILKYNSHIYESILKYGPSNFKLEILEYCDKKSLIYKKQYFMDKLNPEYNILKTAGSSLGFKHSAKTLLKFESRGYTTIVFNKNNNIKKEYNSLRAAAKDLGVSPKTLGSYIKKRKLVKNIFEAYYSKIIS